MTLLPPPRCGITGVSMLAVAWGLSWSANAAEPTRNQTARGQELFFRDWVPGDPRSHGGDGLGPLYNATSCVACHNMGAPGGAGPASRNVDIVTLIRTPPPVDEKQTEDSHPDVNLGARGGAGPASRKVDIGNLTRTFPVDDGKEIDDYHPGLRKSRSLVLHRFGTEPEYHAWRLRRTGGVEFADMLERGGQADLEQVRERMALRTTGRPEEALTRPARSGRALGRVKGGLFLSRLVTFSQRNPSSLFGTGLIDSIPDKVLHEVVERSGPKTRGRLNILKDGRVGRFGWKAQMASLKEFVESACAMELGLEVPTHHQARPPLDFSKKQPGLDLTQDECDALTAFVAGLPAPGDQGVPAGEVEQPAIATGRTLFEKVGCATCHVPKLGPVRGIYSDLLLHEMGTDLGDAGSYYPGTTGGSLATTKEWRTPPLWGFRDSGPYLHDGRAETLEEAVAMHGGQGEPSAQEFFKLKLGERLQVQAFLNSLVTPAPRPVPRVDSR